MSKPSFSSFKALSFDCYGTLIDWEGAIFDQLGQLLDRIPENHAFREQDAVISAFNEIQMKMEREHPKKLYSDVLAACFESIATQAGVSTTTEEAQEFGRRVGKWPAFPDTVDALRQLQKHYKLIILSNVDNSNVRNTIASALDGIEFDAVLTAEDIGSYKPNHANFKALLDTIRNRFGIEQKELLHVAKSLPVDHVPAKELGLTSAWIARGKDGASSMGGHLNNFDDKVAFTWRFASLGDMARDVELDFATKA